MKRIISIIFSVALACVIVTISVTAYFAEAIYVVNGYSYNIITNSSIALCGWDNSSSDLIVPDMIAERYVVSIADYGFEYNEEITSVDFSEAEHLQTIGLDSFCGCSAINSEIVIPETVTLLRESSFQECSSLPSVVINANITTIPKQCFYQCTALENVVLPETLTTIAPFAFADCTSLSYVEIPKSVTSIAPTSFKNDANLTLGVYSDSYAYSYAVENNIPYVILSEGFMLADVNMDGNVNINDVTELQRNLAELEQFNELQELAADANRDGVVDISDATTIQMFLAEYEIPYPIGETITQ